MNTMQLNPHTKSQGFPFMNNINNRPAPSHQAAKAIDRAAIQTLLALRAQYAIN